MFLSLGFFVAAATLRWPFLRVRKSADGLIVSLRNVIKVYSTIACTYVGAIDVTICSKSLRNQIDINIGPRKIR